MTNMEGGLPYIGLYLNRLRLKNGLTITDAASMANISRSHLSLIEKGQRHPGIDVLMRICSVLGTHIHELFLKIHMDLGQDEICKKDNYSEIRILLDDVETILYNTPKRLVN